MSSFRLSVPGLLLAGTLALLLWGQCAGNSSGPTYGVRIVRADSLAADFAGAPPVLYLTIGVRNEENSPFKVESMSGVLIFRNSYWNDSNAPQNQEVVVPARTELQLPLRLQLTDSLACNPDSLGLLLGALHAGTARDSTLQLQLGVNVYVANNAYLQDNGQYFPLPPLASPRRP